MATEKRDRQRANRDQKRAEEEKVETRHQRFALVKRYAFYALIFAVAIIALKLISG